MTGRHSFLLPPLVDDRWITILAGEDVGSSSSSPFQLLAVGMVYGRQRGVWCFHPQSQLFAASQEPCATTTIKPVGAWGPVRRVASPAGRTSFRFADPPVVINRVAHWLCSTAFPESNKNDILALHIDDGRTELIRGLPRKLSNSRTALLASIGDRRGYHRWDPHTRSMHTSGMFQPEEWSFGHWHEGRGRAALLLNLETKEVTHMPADSELFSRRRFFEMDLPYVSSCFYADIVFPLIDK
ncbi:hypothetical protein EJB05_43915, partial [Eragrostis curvula]